jgi:hypothetical protein
MDRSLVRAWYESLIILSGWVVLLCFLALLVGIPDDDIAPIARPALIVGVHPCFIASGFAHPPATTACPCNKVYSRTNADVCRHSAIRNHDWLYATQYDMHQRDPHRNGHKISS